MFEFEIAINADVAEIYQCCHRVPRDYGPGNNQQAIVNPQDLKQSRYYCHARIYTCAGSAL
jgi:hypothetical protein